MNGRVNKVLIVCATLMVGGMLVGLDAGTGKAEQTQSGPVEREASFCADPNLGNNPTLDLASEGLFFKMMLSVGLVIVLGAATWYLSRKLLPRVAWAPGREIRVVDTSYLGPRKALHLVEVGGHKLLIGSTSESITPLAHVGEAWIEMSRPQMDDTVNI